MPSISVTIFVSQQGNFRRKLRLHMVKNNSSTNFNAGLYQFCPTCEWIELNVRSLSHGCVNAGLSQNEKEP